jgi:hypothetical protein
LLLLSLVGDVRVDKEDGDYGYDYDGVHDGDDDDGYDDDGHHFTFLTLSLPFPLF